MNLFWLQLRGETRKLFARKRTFIGFGAFLVFEIVVLFLLRLPPVQRSLSGAIERMGYDPTQYLSVSRWVCSLWRGQSFCSKRYSSRWSRVTW